MDAAHCSTQPKGATTRPGFEPGQREPKSLVLPLHYRVRIGRDAHRGRHDLTGSNSREKLSKPAQKPARHVPFAARRPAPIAPAASQRPVSVQTANPTRLVYPSGHTPDLSTNAPTTGKADNSKRRDWVVKVSPNPQDTATPPTRQSDGTTTRRVSSRRQAEKDRVQRINPCGGTWQLQGISRKMMPEGSHPLH